MYLKWVVGVSSRQPGNKRRGRLCRKIESYFKNKNQIMATIATRQKSKLWNNKNKTIMRSTNPNPISFLAPYGERVNLIYTVKIILQCKWYFTVNPLWIKLHFLVSLSYKFTVNWLNMLVSLIAIWRECTLIY